ncbi:hypothetical protein ACHAP8_012064 [Fusarium lateritium]
MVLKESLPKSGSIVIVGGGIFGLGTALELKKRGYENVTILDRYNIPVPDGSSVDISRVIRVEYASELYATMAREALRGWNSEYKDHFHPSGFVMMADKTVDASYVAKSKSMSERLGDNSGEITDAKQLRTRYPNFPATTEGFNAYVNPRGGWADAQASVRQLSEECSLQGVNFITGPRGTVKSLQIQNKRVRGVYVAEGELISADQVILATGAWSNQIVPISHASSASGQSVGFIQLSPEEAASLQGMPVIIDFTSGVFVFPPYPGKNLLKVAHHGYGFATRMSVDDGKRLVSSPKLIGNNAEAGYQRSTDDTKLAIRTQDGFHDFLQPPPAESLMAAAKSGPIVVINVSLYRCDAILVECERVRLLELPEFTPEKFPEFDRDVSDFKYNPWRFLEWLWTTICRPCLNALGFTEALGGDAQWPHIWWIPTNSFSQFPLHAAGIYAPGSKETVLDRVVSSYASSIKALQHGRQRRRELMDEKNQQNAAIIVAMEETEGQMSLPNAKTETDKKCRVLHFAGHGESKADPSQSCLLLDDWQTSPLTVGHLRQSWLKESPAFLAYLSACSTGSNQGGRLSDEAIHLVSAFQLAGFRHVVGTLWEVSDPHCVDVATILYQTLCEDGMTDEAVSYGLHRALRKLRDDSSWGGTRRDAEREDKRPTEECSLNTYWIPFVHFGA